jgi:hypothetical protein
VGICLHFKLLLLLSSSFLKLPPSLFHELPLLGHTLTLHVDSSAFVAKLKLALASHVVTALSPFHPELAFRALFALLAFDKINKLLVILAHAAVNLVLLAGHILVPFTSAAQTVLFGTLYTLKSDLITLLMKEHIPTVSSWTP